MQMFHYANMASGHMSKHTLFIPQGEYNAQELYGDEPIRLTETPISLSELFV